MTIDAALEIGERIETVTITAETPLLNTAQSSIDDVMTRRAAEDTPLHHRTPYGSIGLVTGALPTGRRTPSCFPRNTATRRRAARERAGN